MPDPTIITLQDVVDHLIATQRGGGQDGEQADIRMAAIRAYNNLMTERDWEFLWKVHRIRLDAPYSTGTAAYDHAASGSVTGATNATPIVVTATAHGLANGRVVTIVGVGGNTAANGKFVVANKTTDTFELTTLAGANVAGNGAYTAATGTWDASRQVTLSGTAPTWAQYGKILFGTVVSDVALRETDTILTLDADRNPGADVAATTFTIYRSVYYLPGDWRSQFSVLRESGWLATYLPPQCWLSAERYWPGLTAPWNWTILREPDEYARWSLRLYGYPSAAETADFLYQGLGRGVKLTGYETRAQAGTITVAAGSDTFTGTSTTFSSDMAGAILRLSSDTSTAPTGIGGVNTYAESFVIAAPVGRTDQLKATTTAIAGYTSTKYTVSDPIDLPTDMMRALYRGAELELAIMRGSDRVKQAAALYDMALLLAKEADARMHEARYKGGGAPFASYRPIIGDAILLGSESA